MAGVAFAVEGDGVGFATESYAASALYTTLASLSPALSRIRQARSNCRAPAIQEYRMPFNPRRAFNIQVAGFATIVVSVAVLAVILISVR